MKKFIAIALLTAVSAMSFAQSSDRQIDSLETLNLEEVFVNATRANDKTPVTFTNVKKDAIKSVNLGQDLPILLKMTPSMVTTSDAGAGVGYTGMRIRGSDATRINVTINGIPLNDSESQGVYWVNMPDLSSSTHSIQIQRGVGTSTNGAAAFGATVNLQTSTPATEAYGMINNTFGSFGTRKHTVMLNSGLMDNHWAFEGRLSKVASEGYIDRSASDLQSYFMSGAYYGDKTVIKVLAFGGKEVTQQAWYGTPEAKLYGNAEDMAALLYFGGEYSTQKQLDNLANSGRTFNYYTYDNEIDHYQQDHYQLHLSYQFNKNWNTTVAGHYTYGRGYYEQFKSDDDLADYGLPNVQIGAETVTSADIIRRRWLDNHFAGFTYSINYEGDKLNTTIGGGYNYYDGDHFGEIIWAEYAGDLNIRDRYYDNVGTKNDFNSFVKVNYQVNEKLNLYADAQVRIISYETKGVDSDLRPIDIKKGFNFFNPKLGATYQIDEYSNIYGSLAIGNREPTRGDFIDSPIAPKHETLQDIEIGYKRSENAYSIGVNLYNMSYNNQLVLTGELDDVGNAVRTNVKDSYRRGLEIEGAYQMTKQLSWGLNATFSQNKIEKFTEIIYNYGDAWEFWPAQAVSNEFSDTDISFSPNVIVGSMVNYTPLKALSIGLQTKFVGDQFLDNTSNKDRAIDAYLVNDLNISYTIKPDLMKEINFQILVNNILDEEYISNGYTWGYMAEGVNYRQNNYFPQAGRNFLFAVNLKF